MPIPCPKCGIINPQGAETCSECGWIIDSTPLSSSAKASQPSPHLSSSAKPSQPSPHLSSSAKPSQPPPSPPRQPSPGIEDLSGEGNNDLFQTQDPGMGNTDFLRVKSKGVSGASILSGQEKRTAPLPVHILAWILWIMSAAMMALSIFFLKPSKSLILAIPWLSSNLPLRVRAIYALAVLAAGIYTLITAYGISNLKRWGLKVYMSWVMIQLVLEILARIYHQQLGAIFSILVLVELIFIPFLWKVKYRFFY